MVHCPAGDLQLRSHVSENADGEPHDMEHQPLLESANESHSHSVSSEVG